MFYQNAPTDFIDKVTEKAEDDYNRIADALGFTRFDFWLWDNRARIYIYDDKAGYQQATLQPGWSYGSALISRKEKTIYSFINEEGFFESVLPHEMGHIIFKEFVGLANPAIPLWLDEGVASYQEGSRLDSAVRVLRKAIKENKFMGLDELFNFNPYGLADSSVVGIFYAEAVSLVDFLIKKFGKDRFVLFCQHLRDKRNFQRAMATAYPFGSIQELDAAWQKSLRDE
ncbi:MAG: peptidase MA family metallohydrolase [Candidatus Omnitrophota bacterium]